MTRFVIHNIKEKEALYELRQTPRAGDFLKYGFGFTGQFLMHWGELQDLYRMVPLNDKKNHGIYLCRYGHEPVKIEDSKPVKKQNWTMPCPDRKYRFK